MGALLILLLLHQTLPALWVAPGLTPCSMQDLSHSHLSGHGSGQAKPKPGQSQRLWLGLRIPEAKATQSQAKASGFQAKPSQNITRQVKKTIKSVAFIDDEDDSSSDNKPPLATWPTPKPAYRGAKSLQASIPESER